MAIGEEGDCEQPDLQTGNPGDCGSYITGTLYLIMYLVLTFLIIINMYIAVILENYSQVNFLKASLKNIHQNSWELHFEF